MQLNIHISNDKSTFEKAMQIRQTVFVDEQNFVDEFDEIDKIAYHAAVFDNDKLIGCGRVFLDEKGCHIGRIAVVKEYRGKKVGSYIVTELEKFGAKTFEFDKYVLSAQTRVKDFYANLGYKEHGDIYFEEHCEHVEMYKQKQ